MFSGPLRINRRLRALLLASGLLIGAPPVIAQSASDPSGLWLTQAGDARVRISRCGAAYCGTVAALSDPIDPKTGRPQADEHNPNPALVNRPIIGIRLFSDMRPAGPAKWSGHIYNADDGKTYESNISLTGPGTLRVEGCVMGLCGGENWSRVGRK
jgi:uncharacterized protein (DUF2147 family)